MLSLFDQELLMKSQELVFLQALTCAKYAYQANNFPRGATSVAQRFRSHRKSTF